MMQQHATHSLSDISTQHVLLGSIYRFEMFLEKTELSHGLRCQVKTA